MWIPPEYNFPHFPLKAFHVRFVPDVVITLGGALVSRFVKEFLRKCEAVEHWSLDNSDMMADCFRHLTLKIDVDPAVFFARVGMYLKRYESDSDYKEIWETRRCAALLSQKEFIQRAGWCDLTAHYIIFNSLPTDYNVVCSNGTAVRYAELFASVSQHAVCCNRGTSGIEGCTATAVGSAMAYNGETILLSGDMSLMHDLGGLSIARRLAPRLKIVVFNNGGGDIFRFIATTSRLDECEEYFACNQSATLDCSALAAAFGLKYIRVHSVEELQCGMTTLLASSECMLLEVDTRGYDNAGILRAYMQRTVK